MSLKVGIVGLPNVGKSTLFNVLLSKQVAFAANYPFATIEPNIGVVEVPDERLPKLAKVVHTEKLVPAAIEFIDIAGLVAGAHKGEGLGNKFLSHIREVDVIAYVLREFADPNVTLAGSETPLNDYQILMTELQLADLQVIERQKEPKGNPTKEDLHRWDAVQKIQPALEAGKNVNTVDLTDEEKLAIKSFSLLSLKPVITVVNTDPEKISNRSEKIDNNPTVFLCAKIEAQMVSLPKTERQEMLDLYEIPHSGLDELIKVSYEKLGLITFLTAGVQEVRAWPIRKGTLAPQAAGTIHTDFEKAFIKAKIASYGDFVSSKGWSELKESGKIRLEGKEYIMQEGDVVEFMVNA
jgi:GTP-binding protein YchF